MVTLRAVAERALLRASAVLPDRAPHNGALILAYHGVRPMGEAEHGERSLHVAWNRFLAHLDVLERCARVVSLDDALSVGPHAPELRKRVVITFDDAYDGAVQLALPELARRGWPCTVFVPTDLLGVRAFWWDRAAELTGGALEAAARDHAIDSCAGDALAVAKDLDLADANALPWYMACASEDSLLKASRDGAVTLAPHTANHLNVVAIPEHRLQNELARSLAWCDQFPCGRPILAFPYGRWSPALAPLIATSGIRHALRVNGGWLSNESTTSPMAIPRLNVPASLSPDRLELSLRGFGIRT